MKLISLLDQLAATPASSAPAPRRALLAHLGRTVVAALPLGLGAATATAAPATTYDNLLQLLLLERLQAALDAADTHGLPRYESFQPEYNLYNHAAFEQQDLPVVQASGIGVIPYFGLASGFLTGKYRNEADLVKSVRGSTIGQKYLNEQGKKLLAAMDAVADTHSATLAQVALAWLMQAPGITAPIASATSPGQIKELLEAMALQLTAEDVAALQAARPVAAATNA